MLNIFCGTTLFAQDKSLYNVLKSNRDGTSHNIFIVPDRYSLSTEKAIFENLDILSAFDIDVLTLSRLASKTMPAFNDIGKTAGIMIVKKVLLENKSKFKCFDKALLSAGFSEDLYSTISQLKSCKVSPEQIYFDNAQDYLQLKMNDIALVYENYQKYLNDNNLKDSSDKFEEFEQIIQNSDFIKNSHIYISHFDSMTLQGYQIIKQLMQTAKSVNIAVTKNNNAANNHIYLNDMYNTIVGLAASANIKPNFYNCDSGTVGQYRHLENNLFAYKPQVQKLEQSKIEIFEHITLEEELIRAATKIVAGVKNKDLLYRDYAIAIAGLETKVDVVKKVLDKFGISYYLDATTEYQDTILFKFLDSAFRLVNRYYRKTDIIAFAKNIFVQSDDVDLFEDFVNKYSIEGGRFVKELDYLKQDADYQVYNNVRQNILQGISILSAAFDKEQKTSVFSQAIKDLLICYDVNTKLNNLALHFASSNLQMYKLLPQLLPKLIETLDGLDQVLGSVEMSCVDYIDILNCGLKSISLSTTPLSCDSVFVGDASKSLFDRVKTLIILGCNENDLPYYKQDCGIITDKEIQELSIKYKIEPTIKTINQRERYKLFNLLVSPLDNLVVSYHIKNGNDKVTGASWVKQIKEMFLVKFRDEYLPLDVFTNAYNNETFIENLATTTCAQTKLLEYLRFVADGYRFTNEDDISTLYNVLKDKCDYAQYLNYDNSNKKLAKNVFFVNNTLSVSQIERFYDCPFKHFVDYGLKLKQKQIGDIDNMQVGNILHELIKVFVDKYKADKNIDIQSISQKIFDTIMQKPDYVHLLHSPQNKMQLVSLKKEAARLCSGVAYQMDNSDFRPIFTEARFSDNGKIKSITIQVGKYNLKLVGAVDRIDAFGDYFRIIDYKTGSCDANLNQLYYGKKLQLYAYQKVVHNNLKLKPAGCYYLPVSSKYQKDDEDTSGIYKLKGYTARDNDVIFASDKNLVESLESNIIEVKRNAPTKKEQYVYSSYSKLASQQDLLNFADYAIAMIKQAVEQIVDGNINVSPLKLASNKSACEYCPYHALCRFDEKLNNTTRHLAGKVEIASFEEVQK